VRYILCLYINCYLYIGLVYAVDGLKSVILTLATVERVINIPEAVNLSRLEEEYQVYIALVWFDDDKIKVNWSPHSALCYYYMWLMIHFYCILLCFFIYRSLTGATWNGITSTANKICRLVYRLRCYLYIWTLILPLLGPNMTLLM